MFHPTRSTTTTANLRLKARKRVLSEVDENDLDNVFHLCDRRLRGVSVPHASTGIARAGNGTG
jgi:hypothetical protein